MTTTEHDQTLYESGYFPDTHDSVGDPVTDNKHGIPRIANETRPINYSFRLWKQVN